MSEEKPKACPETWILLVIIFKAQHDKAFSRKGPVSASQSERDTLYIHLSGHQNFFEQAEKEGGATDNNWPKY